MFFGIIGYAFVENGWIIGIVSYIAFLIYILNPVQIVVTDEHILFRNLFFRTVRYVKYDEITRVDHDFSMSHGGKRRWNPTSIRTRHIVLKNGKVISIDDNTYRNFREIDNCIVENIEKNKRTDGKRETITE